MPQLLPRSRHTLSLRVRTPSMEPRGTATFNRVNGGICAGGRADEAAEAGG
jgi:hypothetical protein